MKKITLLFVALVSVISMSAEPYLKGTFNGWGGDHKFVDGKVTVLLNGGSTYKFKVEDSGAWYGNNGTMTSDNCSNWTFSTSEGDAGITTTITGNYIFVWDAGSKKMSVTYPTEAAKIDYYIAGTVIAAGWNEKGQIMTENDGVYTYTCAGLAAGTYEFKITNGTWSGALGFDNLDAAYAGVTRGTGDGDNNIVVNLTEATDLTITLTGIKISLNLPVVSSSTTWTVAGDCEALFGTAWCTTCSDNDLEEGENGIWTKTYEDVTLLKGEIKYKIAKDHKWDESYAGEPKDDKGNTILAIEYNGVYDVTFTFDVVSKAVSAEAKFISYPVAVEDVVLSDVYVQNNTIIAEGEFQIFSITGQNVTDMNGSLTRGAYIVRTAAGVAKVMIK